jgi:hypothetical protein
VVSLAVASVAATAGVALLVLAANTPNEKTESDAPTQARTTAARFLGRSPENVKPRPSAASRAESNLAPARWDFILSEGPEETSPIVGVNAATGEVWSLRWRAEQNRRGDKDVSPEEAYVTASEYVKQHWPHWSDSAELELQERVPTKERATYYPATWVPYYSLRWVLREGDVRVGFAAVEVNATTGVVFGYHQGYYSAKGMPPPALTAKDAQSFAWEAIAEQYRARYSFAGDPQLQTRWAKGKARLVWIVQLKESVPVPTGEAPHVQNSEAQVDAHTGEIYAAMFPRAAR